MKRSVLALVFPMLFAVLLIASEVKLDGVKCIVGGEAASASVSADYQDGKVYFCCENCLKKFKADPAKYATKANHQLVASGQAKQASCPLSGGKVDEGKVIEVNGAKVYFCCDQCKGKAASAAGDQQMEMLFGEAAWKKAGYKVGN